MSNYKISVIIPIYNSERYLDKCITSVMDQTYKDLEIILINDGSTDNSLNICNFYASIDNRIRVIDKSNGGVSSARNSGLEIATGNFIGFVDSDDYIDKRMYEALIHAINENKADVAECGFCTTDSNYTIKEKVPLKNAVVKGSYQNSLNYLAKINTTNFNVNKLYKKHLFDGLRYPSFVYSEDFTVNVKVFYKCNKKVTISGVYYYYYNNVTSASNRPFSKLKLDVIKAGAEIYKYHQERYTDLCPFIALYISNHIIWMYQDLQNSNDNSNLYEKILIDEYKKYYPLVEGDVVGLISYKRRIAFWLFSKEPKLLYYLQKIMGFIK